MQTKIYKYSEYDKNVKILYYMQICFRSCGCFMHLPSFAIINNVGNGILGNFVIQKGREDEP